MSFEFFSSNDDELHKMLAPLPHQQLVQLMVQACGKFPDVNKFISEHLAIDLACRKIFVRKLASETTSAVLKEVFEQFGEVMEAAVIFDKLGRSKCFGFVTFVENQSALLALREPYKFIDGRKTESWLAAQPGRRDRSELSPSITSPSSTEYHAASPSSMGSYLDVSVPPDYINVPTDYVRNMYSETILGSRLRSASTGNIHSANSGTFGSSRPSQREHFHRAAPINLPTQRYSPNYNVASHIPMLPNRGYSSSPPQTYESNPVYWNQYTPPPNIVRDNPCLPNNSIAEDFCHALNLSAETPNHNVKSDRLQNNR